MKFALLRALGLAGVAFAMSLGWSGNAAATPVNPVCDDDSSAMVCGESGLSILGGAGDPAYDLLFDGGVSIGIPGTTAFGLILEFSLGTDLAATMFGVSGEPTVAFTGNIPTDPTLSSGPDPFVPGGDSGLITWTYGFDTGDAIDITDMHITCSGGFCDDVTLSAYTLTQDEGNMTRTRTTQAVPTPAPLALLASGLLGLGVVRLRAKEAA